jgi:hypothetical protein
VINLGIRCPMVTQSPCGNTPSCDQLRQDLDIGPISDSQNNIIFLFKNELRNFVDSVVFCQSLGVGWRMITVEELAQISRFFIGPNGEGCGTLVWTLDNGTPTLAYVAPCNGDEVQIIRVSPLTCLAFTICVFQE